MSVNRFTRVFKSLASLKVAIPLLVVTVAVTVIGSLFPKPDFFRTWWYLGLLGLNGVSLLFVTILHTPLILRRKGRNALIGVVVTHLGILILIAGAIYGGMSGFRHQVKVIEGEMTSVPDLPFFIRLDRLVIEDYPAEVFAGEDPDTVIRKKQDSHLTLARRDGTLTRLIARPGGPARIDGITILPSFSDFGWYFELIAIDPVGKQTIMKVRPWAPPMITVGATPIMAHALMDSGGLSAQILTMADGQITVLGNVSKEQAIELNGYSISLGQHKRYTGLSIYNRPQMPVLILGCLAMLFGLVWHFYHRHRDLGRENRAEI